MTDRSLTEFVVDEHATLLDAIETIERNHSRCAVVCSGEKVLGVISEGDVLRALLRGVEIHRPVEGLYNVAFHFLTEPDKQRALELFRQYGISMIPVLDEAFTLKGVVTLRELLGKVNLA